MARLRVQQLAFRQTAAQYGVDLTWTPMVRSFFLLLFSQMDPDECQILAKEFNRSVFARDSGEHVIWSFLLTLCLSLSLPI